MLMRVGNEVMVVVREEEEEKRGKDRYDDYFTGAVIRTNSSKKFFRPFHPSLFL